MSCEKARQECFAKTWQHRKKQNISVKSIPFHVSENQSECSLKGGWAQLYKWPDAPRVWGRASGEGCHYAAWCFQNQGGEMGFSYWRWPCLGPQVDSESRKCGWKQDRKVRFESMSLGRPGVKRFCMWAEDPWACLAERGMEKTWLSGTRWKLARKSAKNSKPAIFTKTPGPVSFTWEYLDPIFFIFVFVIMYSSNEFFLNK